MLTFDRIVIAFIGAAIGWLLQQYRLARSEDVALVNEHIKDIERFSDSAQAYWLTQPKDENEEFQLSAKVRAHHASVTLLYDHILHVCRGQMNSEYVTLSRNLFRAATGGAFESSGRGVHPSRAIEIADVSSRLIHGLRLERGKIISLERAWAEAVQRLRAAYGHLKSNFIRWINSQRDH